MDVSLSGMTAGWYCSVSFSNYYLSLRTNALLFIGSLSVLVWGTYVCVWVTRTLSRCRIQLLFSDTVRREASRVRMWLPKAGFSATAGVCVCVCMYTGAHHVYVHLLSVVHVCAHCSTEVHRCMCAPWGRGRIARTSTVCILWLMLQPTDRRRGGEGGDTEGDGSRLTRCEIITSAHGCRKPYIRGGYANEITAKGLIGQ